ncbi:1-acyl-sn-glycerol-3-phosphate acyltransferase [Gregarina niphandrodes]|uniref:1-acyl-sn-glycerol-3-phosphate acyltransferase n=1 Tax=Gregarina niphandrodes TaxID=110365 RepID=A0A023B0Z5_GRENI|nr:1-acyl-sn-glycerol-3-phosphate acyltransferase [Gregarina niphandrodes]EZG45053.1 1-acyl-sn-glycerol-3-phosphate acyltransferase [Gregarina niphandrodes]|eukprot:XP_011132584.1 1-acyl-sn-glycerol-3-phosphate acyltransferase [Gregarina niphandrodes]
MLGWPIDFGAYFICRTLHTLGIWQVTILGSKPKWRLNQEEWSQWKPAHTRVDPEDGVLEVSLPSDKEGGLTAVGGSMVVSNHMSNIDGFLLKACFQPMTTKALIKSGVIKAPFVGQLLWLSGQCFVWGNRRGSGVKDKDKTYSSCAEAICNNVPVICFPEGTRRMFGRMNPFKLGMIGAAIDYEWPIHVSIIHGSHRAWPPRELLVNRHPIYVKFADYVIIPRRGLDTADSMANAIRRRMLRLMLDVPGHDPVVTQPTLILLPLSP